MSRNIIVDGGQIPLFDIRAGQKEKEKGIARASAGKAPMIRYIREQLEVLYIDRYVQIDDPYVTADDARKFLKQYYGGAALPKGGNNFMGSIFRDRKWVRTGRMVPSLVKGNHARLIPCWRLRGPEE